MSKTVDIGGWQDIATAPHGADEWVVFTSTHNRYARCAVEWNGLSGCWIDYNDEPVDMDMFTHWMPLPAPPIDAAMQAEGETK